MRCKVLAMSWRPVKRKFCHFWISKRYLFGPQIGTFLDQNRYRKVLKSFVLLCLWRFLSFPFESVKIRFSANLWGPERVRKCSKQFKLQRFSNSPKSTFFMIFQFFRGPRHAQNSGKHNVLEDSWTLLGISSDRIYDLLHFHMFLI